jgi:divalent metal cation (Fe/Co/Zn/Cd) transporter
MKYRYIPAAVMLLAGLVCCILSVVQRWPVMTSLIALVIVLLVFYIVGQIAAGSGRASGNDRSGTQAH